MSEKKIYYTSFSQFHDNNWHILYFMIVLYAVFLVLLIIEFEILSVPGGISWIFGLLVAYILIIFMHIRIKYYIVKIREDKFTFPSMMNLYISYDMYYDKIKYYKLSNRTLEIYSDGFIGKGIKMVNLSQEQIDNFERIFKKYNVERQ